MALPINIESLLSGSAVESNQLEFKEGWTPDAIYRSVCAFANDFEDTGGGYIIVGVKEEHGRAVRPELGALNFGGPNLPYRLKLYAKPVCCVLAVITIDV